MVKYLNKNTQSKEDYEYKEFIKPQVGDVVLIEDAWTKGRNYFYLVNFVDPNNEWISAIRIHPNNYRYAGTKELEIPGEYLRCSDVTMPCGSANIFTGITSLHIGGIREIVSHLPKNKYMDIVGCIISMLFGNFFIDKDRSLILKDFNIDIKMPINLTTILHSAVGLTTELEMKSKEDSVHLTKSYVSKEESKIDDVQGRFDRALKKFQKTNCTDKVPVMYMQRIIEGSDYKVNGRTYLFSKAEIEGILEKSNSEITNCAYERVDGEFECPSNGASIKKAAAIVLPYLH